MTEHGTQQAGQVTLSLVVPVFNEEDSLDTFLRRINEVFQTQALIDLELVFVNDGSTDATLERLLDRQRHDSRLRIVDLSRNFGKEAALSAGLQIASGQIVVPIDADLQDPPEVILQMIERWREGYEVVLGHRISRRSDTWAKQTSAHWFYRLHNKIAEQPLPENVGDFRLMDRCVVDALLTLPESRRFMKGLFAWVGFRTAAVDYVRESRVAGTSSFNGWRLWNLAVEGITGFSITPLRIWSYMGLVVAGASLAWGTWILVRTLIFGHDIPGYASLFVAVTFLGGLQLIGIGIVGEYVGRTYIESKRRPPFVVRRVYRQPVERGSSAT